MSVKTLLLFVFVLVLSLSFFACGTDDTDTDGDQDIQVDGDTDSLIDGDTESATDGDSEPVADNCDNVQPGQLCFTVDSTDFAGVYHYVENTDAPSSGCEVDGSDYTATFYNLDNGVTYTSMNLGISAYNGKGDYSDSTTLLMWWDFEDLDGLHSFKSTAPCTATLSSDNAAQFNCSLYDATDALLYFKVSGSYVCAE